MSKLKIYLVISILLFSCNYPKRGFYEDTKSDFDLWRIPLIKPYEINSTSRNGSWGLLMSSKFALKFDCVVGIAVDSIGLSNDIIVIKDKLVYINSTMSPAWFVYNVNETSGKCFTDRETYLSYLKTKYQISNINLYDPHKIYEQFEKNMTLPSEWQPYINAEKTKQNTIHNK